MTLKEWFAATGFNGSLGLRATAASVSLPDSTGEIKVFRNETLSAEPIHLTAGEISLRNLLNLQPRVAKAMADITNFEQHAGPQSFEKVPKRELVEDMRKTILNPLNEIKQSKTPLCGPASIAFELARRDPQRFVKMCRDLHETGKFKARGDDVKPSEDTRASRNPISAADWVIFASLRDDKNKFNDVEEDVDNIEGYTLPGEMKDWIDEILQLNYQEYEKSVLGGEIDALKEAQEAIDRGGVAFLNIHSDLLDKAQGDSNPIFENHWIVFLGRLSRTSGDSSRVKFTCFSWGRRYDVDVPKSRFENLMWGTVRGW